MRGVGERAGRGCGGWGAFYRPVSIHVKKKHFNMNHLILCHTALIGKIDNCAGAHSNLFVTMIVELKEGIQEEKTE